MTPFLSMPSVQPQLPVQTSAVVGMPTQISTMKLPLDAVPATVNAETIYNNTRGSRSPSGGAAAGGAIVPANSGGLLPVIAGVDFRPSVQFSSPFLAQLFAQTPGSQIQAMTEFFVNDNEPHYVADPALMALYSAVKYKPSNASVPTRTHNVAAEMKSQQSRIMQQLAEQKAQQMQRQVRSEAVVQQSSRQIFIQVPPTGNAGTGGRPLSQQSSSGAPGSPFQAKSFRSLIQPTGVDAYMASFSRNIANLVAQPDTVQVAL